MVTLDALHGGQLELLLVAPTATHLVSDNGEFEV